MNLYCFSQKDLVVYAHKVVLKIDLLQHKTPTFSKEFNASTSNIKIKFALLCQLVIALIF